LVVCFLLFSSAGIVYSIQPVIIEYFYFFELCPRCSSEARYIYEHNTQVLDRIEGEYGSKVLVKRIPFYSEEGKEKREQYHFEVWDQNVIVINGEVIIKGYANETYVRDFIDYYLGVKPSPPQRSSPSPPPSLSMLLALTFTFGFFETFSPCLIAMLSFVLSYTITEESRFKKKFLQVITFGIGFIFATVLMFSASVVGLVALSLMLGLQYILMWTVCVFAILFGLDLLGFSVFKILKIKAETKALIQKLTRKYAFTYFGLVALGFLFYFLDPCIAPVFVALIATFEYTLVLRLLPFILFIFCLAVIIPFIVIGVLSGFISKLTRSTYRHRTKMRAVSGLILIAYSIYLVFYYLLPNIAL